MNAYRNKLGIAVAGTLAAMALSAQTPGAAPILSLTAVTENVSAAKDPIRIDILRWSTDAERDELLSAWNMTLAPAPAAGARGGRGGAGGGGGRGGGRGAGAAPAAGAPAAGAAAPDAGGDAGAAADGAAPAAPAAAAAPAAGRGGGGRGGGGGGRGGRGGGGAAADTPKPTPEGTLAAELVKVPTLGYVWSSEVAGYALHYAVKLPSADGGQRILLVTDRRLGAWNDHWNLTAPGATPGDAAKYEFSVIELRLNAKNEGEGKASLTGKLAVDTAAKTIALDSYDSAPVVFKTVKKK